MCCGSHKTLSAIGSDPAWRDLCIWKSTKKPKTVIAYVCVLGHTWCLPAAMWCNSNIHNTTLKSVEEWSWTCYQVFKMVHSLLCVLVHRQEQDTRMCTRMLPVVALLRSIELNIEDWCDNRLCKFWWQEILAWKAACMSSVWTKFDPPVAKGFKAPIHSVQTQQPKYGLRVKDTMKISLESSELAGQEMETLIPNRHAPALWLSSKVDKFSHIRSYTLWYM